MGADVEQAWRSPAASSATRKPIVRTLIDEIVVRVENDSLDAVIRWQGGDHTALSVPKNHVGQHRWSTDADVVELLTELVRQLPDQSIAAVLNRAGKTTGRGNGWTRSRVCFLRNHRIIAPYRSGERAERGEVTLDEAADILNVSEATVRRLIATGILPAHQFCKGAPWVIRSADLEQRMSGVQQMTVAPDVRRLKICSRIPWLFNTIAR